VLSIQPGLHVSVKPESTQHKKLIIMLITCAWQSLVAAKKLGEAVKQLP